MIKIYIVYGELGCLCCGDAETELVTENKEEAIAKAHEVRDSGKWHSRVYRGGIISVYEVDAEPIGNGKYMTHEEDASPIEIDAIEKYFDAYFPPGESICVLAESWREYREKNPIDNP